MIKIAFAMIAASSFACGGNSREGVANLKDSTGQTLPILETLYYGPSPFPRTVREVVIDTARWHAVRDSIGMVNNRGPVSEVDFSRQSVVIAAGPAMLLGDSLAITAVERAHQAIRVQINLFTQCSVVTATIIPAHIILVPRFSVPVEFQETEIRPPECPRL